MSLARSLLRFRNRNKKIPPVRNKVHFEPLEPRLLLSGDLKPEAADALAAGLDLLGTRLDNFVASDALLDERIPLLLTVEKVGDEVIQEAPTINELFTVPVDANGDGEIDNFLNFSDDDESALDLLDANNDGKVGVEEFLKGWFFDRVTDYLNGHPPTTTDFADFLEDGTLFDPIDHSLDDLSGFFVIDFNTDDAKVADTTEDPDAEVTFSVGFELSITRYGVPLDLGLEADALKLLAFTGSADNPQLPKIDTVTSTLSFAFDFGVFTGGQDLINIDQNDFFIRKADPLVLSVAANDGNIDFNLNVGFLGAQVIDGTLNLQADINTTLIDPNDPDVLGFVDSQHGVEQPGGVVTATNPVTNADLAHEAGFFLRIGNVGITTPVTVADNGRSSLTDLKSDIEAALTAAGLDDLIDVSLVGAGSDTVRFSLVPTSDTPLGFGNETLDLTGVILATPDGDGPNIFEYLSDQTFLLSIGGALPKLVTVNFPDPSHTDVGFNDSQAASVPPLVAPNAASAFDISADAGFTVTVWKNDGTTASASITLTETDTDGNGSAAALAQDIDNKFIGSSVYPLVLVNADANGHIRFSPINSSVSAIRVEASGTATSEIGFASDATVGLQLLGANAAVANLSEAANFKLTLNDAGTITTYAVTVPDNNRGTLNELAADINTAIDAAVGSDRINVVVSSGKILLAGNDTDVRSFSVRTINLELNDLVADVNRALSAAGLGAAVTASADGTNLKLTASGGKSLEISKTLTFDAGVTYAELNTTPTAGLFDADKGAASHVLLNLPVHVLTGLEDATTAADDDWTPPDVAIVGNFIPFDADSAVAEYDPVVKRFDLSFTFDPATTVPEQDTHVPLPAVGDLTDEIRLVNFAELLNFNLVGPDGMVGLLMSLGTALQQIGNSGLFSNFDIPFAKASLSKLLNFADSDKARLSGLIDMLVFDTGGDGIDGSNADTDKLLRKITVDSTSYLAPAFTTAQTLATTLASILGAPLSGAGGINATYDKVTNELTYQVDLLSGERTKVAVDVPFEYDVALNPFAKLTVDTAAPPSETNVSVTGRTGLGMTFGINLSPPGAIIYPDTKLSKLNGGAGVDIKTQRAFTGTVSIPQVTPATPTPDPIYQLDGDAVFWLSINGGDAQKVTIPRSVTLNRTIGDLVADVNNALVEAGIDGDILADFDGARLVLTARNDSTTFTITSVNFFAFMDLGLTAPTDADQADFVIFDRAGGKHVITLDGLLALPDPTVQDVIDLINSVTGAAVTAELNSTHTGLRLVDNTGGTGDFKVDTINGSGALLQLGFFRAGNTGSPYEVNHGDPNLIEGGGIGLTHLDDRFFVRDAQMRIDGLAMQTPPVSMENPDGGVPGTALFGIVGVSTNVTGTMYADVTADLKDPDTGIAGGQVSLAELFEGGKQGRLSASATFSVDLGSGPVSVTVPKAATVGINANNSIDDLVLDVNKALHDAGLDTQIYAKADETRLVFVAKSASVPGFTITASGTAVTELGLRATQSSEKVGKLQTLSARAASRFAVDEPVVTEVSELTFGNYVDGSVGEFTPGSMVYGWEDTDNSGIPDTFTGGAALILDVKPGMLTLAHVKGTFANADWITNTADLMTSTIGAFGTGSEATQKANFGDFNLHVVVQPGFDDIGFGDDFALIKDKIYDVPFSLTNFGNPFDPQPPVAAMDLSGIGDLAAFEHLSYSHLDDALQGLLVLLQDVEAKFTLLSTPLPAINKSVSDLLSLVDGFARGVANADEAFQAATDALAPDAVDLPALRLQDIPKALRGAFGLPTGVDPDAAGAVDWVRLDFDNTNNILLVDLSLHESLSTKLGLDIEVGSGLPNLTSGGVLKVSGSLDVMLNFGIDLDTPEDAYLFDTSSIAASLKVEGEGQEYAGGADGMGLVFRAALGPLAVFIQDGDALIDVSFKLPGLNFGGADSRLISYVTFEDFNEPVIPTNHIEIVLPMFYGGEGPNDYIGDFEATGSLPYKGTGGLDVVYPDFSEIKDDILAGTVAFDPFDNILLGIDTLNFYLEGLSDIVAEDVLGINLPFVGDQMADALFIESFRNTLVRTLKNGIENAINPDPDTIVNSLLQSALAGYLVGGIEYTKDVSSENIADWYRQWNFTLGKTKTYTFDDFDIGIPGLGFDVKIPVNVNFAWELDLGFGVNFTEGAYIDVSNDNELDLDLTITLPDGTYTGWLGFLELKVSDDDEKDTTPEKDSGANLYFDVNVQKGDDTIAGHLGFSDLGSINPVASLTGTDLSGGNEAVSLYLKGEIAGIPVLPRINTYLMLDWSLPKTGLSEFTYGGNAVLEGLQTIAYQGITLDGGSIVTDFLRPILDKIHAIIEPFMPVVDTLTYPIPILSDIAGEPFTLLDLAAIFGDVNPDFIEAVADILTLIDKITAPETLPAELPIGNLTLYDVDTGVPQAGFDPTDPASRLSDIVLTDATPGLTFADANNNDKRDFDETVDASPLLKGLRDQEFAKGLSTPILTDPLQGTRMLLAQDAVFIDYVIPPLGVEFSYLQVFPIWGPLSVSIEISFGFTVDLHSVGFDTSGLGRFAKGGFRNPAVIFDGFYLNDLNTEGVDAPEVTFEFGLVGAAELNLGIARAGVGGGINATINFDWYDAIPDGRVHVSELAGSMWANGLNPLAVFDVSGALTFQMFAFLEISIIGFKQEFPITPETELFSFDIPFDRPPVLAEDIDGGVLQLNIGPNAKNRLNGDTSDGHEEIFAKYDSGNVLVWSPRLGVSESDAQSFSGVSQIVGLGGEGNDIMNLNLTGSNITYTLEGGTGDDNITVTGGTGGGTIRGGVGNDTLTGGDGNDIIYGEQGNDVINGSGGYDILFGDQGRIMDVLPGDPLITSRVRSSDGADTINGGTEDDIIIGAGGDDILNGDAGNDVIIGDGGRFAYLLTGDGHFDINSVRPAPEVYPYMPEEIDTDTPTDPDTISKDIDKIYDAVVGTFSATDLGLGGNDTISGGENDDIILGGSGDDIINGDGGADIILSGKGFDDVHGGAGNDTIFGGDQADTIFGDGNDDVISGGAGNDLIHGNAGNDVMKGDSGADVMYGDAGDDQVFGQTEPDVLFGGVDDDLVVGGTSNDIMFGDDGLVAKLDPDDGSGVKVIGIGFGGVVPAGQFYDSDIRTVDLIITDVVAGDGNDILSGDAADDIILGGGGNDLMGGDVDPRLPTFERPTEISEDVMIGDGGKIVFDHRRFKSIATVIEPVIGTEFDDKIYGDNGNDYIFGGWGDDILAGGHGPNRGPTDPEASDNDVIIGDNGELIFADDSIMANFGRLELIRTTDIANDTGGADTAYGEEGADVILGGVNNDDGLGDPEVDRLYGDYYDYTTAVPEIFIGNDVILGDNGLLDFASGLDTNLDTLDLIHSEPYAVTDWSTEPPTLDKNTILGGTDIIDGSFGYDVLIGGVGGDTMYGDDETASNADDDGEDIMLGDNADIFLIGTEGRLLVQVAAMTVGTAVDLITTTDTEDVTGGADTMSGNAKADIMFGGVNNGGEDTMYGDRSAPNATTIANDGDDILVGDNGLLDFTFGGDESGLDRQTLDLIRSLEDKLGGKDVISGNKGLDVAIGGTGGDEIYGDDANASAAADDFGDLLLGDNADIFLVPRGAAAGGDIKLVLPLNLPTDAAVKTIRTTDTVSPLLTGGSDTISGNAKGDIIAGGVYGDTIYGDREFPNATTEDNEGDDIILGDNGAFEWLSTGRLNEITGIDIAANNAALWTKYGTGSPDTDLTTLDLVSTEQPNSGGRDLIYGDQGRDLVFAGTDADTIYGDDGTLDEIVDSDNNDLLFGDHGRIYPQFSSLRLPGQDWRLAFNSRNFFAIDIGDTKGGEGDRMWGEEGDDTMVGQQGDDRMWGGSGDDDMTGGHNVAGGYDELGAPDGLPPYPAIDANLSPAIGVPAIAAVNDLMDGGTGNDSMAGDNAIIWRRGDDLSPRFRVLTAAAMNTTTRDTIVTNVGGSWQSDPDDAVGRDIQLVDHSDAVEADPQGRFGSDVMAGGADSDVMFGELANDLMQGDGFIGTDDANANTITYHVGVTDSGTNPDTDQDLYFNIPEASTDADDYMEGNGANDLMYGGLGQDDIIGGSSALFGLDEANAVLLDMTAEELRPDASDFIFGGAGLQIDRNDALIRIATLQEGSQSNNEKQTIAVRPIGGQYKLVFGDETTDYIADNADAIAVKTALVKLNSIGDNDVTVLKSGNVYTIEFQGALEKKDVLELNVGAIDIGHARDADFIMGDNANVYRLVNSSDAFLTFNYDNYGTLKIIPRAMQQLDYTLGGSDYWADGVYGNGVYNKGAAKIGNVYDNGLADLIHGESGDDIIFGMTGSDVIFGEGQDDDIVGGYGNDWISGGTGQDGVLGDDGLIYTSRNSTVGEPLYGVAPLLANTSDPHPKYSDGYVLDEVISTPGQIQYAVINQSGQLKKAIDAVPFSYDSMWLANDDEFPDYLGVGNTPFADDIIFGGLGSDWLHGGSGDDAISGAEALPDAYVPDYGDIDTDGITAELLNLGYTNAKLPANLNLMNPGDVLAFNPEDTDGRHLNNRFRAGEFALYNEYLPLHKILLNPDGTLWDPITQPAPTNEFLLNFDKTEGVYRAAGTVPKATGQQTETYGAVRDDGRDAIFGDLGNDWLVGGTGADDIYGGWGNDLLNVDDDQTTNNNLNDMPDTHPFYQDRAYGGAGRDVLIGNTGGDRLIDWVGEYNSYLVPYAPFGEASVSRTLQPFLPEFLYALSAGDGADFTRYRDAIGGTPPAPTSNNPNPSRNGEPHGELGLVLQKDFAWQDQTGAPADPQAGNIPGGPRDVLRSAGFNDSTAEGFYVATGTWSVVNGRYQVAPAVKGGDALSVFYVDQYIPNYFEMLATINAVKPTAGYNANAYLVFDYQSDIDFKFAGINVSTNKLEIGYRDASGWKVLVQKPYTTQLKSDTDYNVFLALNGTNVILTVDNRVTLSYTFAPRVDVYGLTHGLKDGMVGLGGNNGKAKIDNVVVQRLAPVLTINKTVDFSSGTTALFQAPLSGTWTLANGRYDGAAGATPAIDLTSVNVTSSSVIDFSATFRTTGEGGFVYDQYSAEDFKYVTISAGKITLGHRTSRGWFTDVVFNNAALITGSDYTLGLTLKNNTVSILLNNQLVLSKTYNALVTDGNFGLFSRSGVTSFDTVTFKTDDSALAQNLMASGSNAQTDSNVALTYGALAPIVEEAVERWSEALGNNDSLVASLYNVSFQIVDFNDLTLGRAIGDTVLIDIDAAGYGWFVDMTPYDEVEFSLKTSNEALLATGTSEAYGHMDLLTVIMHELGHILGFEDLYSEADKLMSARLDPGERHTVGDTNNQVQDDSASLVVMDGAKGQFSSEESIRPQNSWLHSWLLSPAYNDSYGPNKDIQIVIPRQEGEDNTNLRRIYGKGKRT